MASERRSSDDLQAASAATGRVLARGDCAALDWLQTPVWVFDTEHRGMWWANQAAVALWSAADLEELLARDFAADMSAVTAARLKDYLRRFRAGETVLEQWTFYPRGRPVTVHCTCSGVRIDDGRLAMLVEGRPPPEAATGDALRGVEAVRYAPVPIVLFDTRGRALFHNPAATEAFGPVAKGAAGGFVERFREALVGERIWRQVQAGTEVSDEVAVLTRSGERRHRLRCRLTEDPATGAPAVLAVHEDVTEIKRTQASLEKLSRAVEHSGSAVMITDAGARIEYVNPQFTRLTGYTAAEVIGRTPAMLRTGETPPAVYAQLWSTIGAGEVWRGELHNRRRDGSLYWNLLTIAPILDPGGRIRHFVGVSEDVTALKEAHARAEQLSRYDGLTGLANRRHFAEQLADLVAAAQQGGSAAALLFLDLDGFKEINDTLGHALGDRLLCDVAHRLRATAGDGDTVARLGGDEFALLLPGCAEAEAAAAMAQRILAALRRPLHLPGLQRPVASSIGITLLPQDGADADALLRNADLAMYSAKQAGRGRWAFFRPDMNAAITARVQLEQELREALRTDAVMLCYQPVLRLADMAVVGAEALVRWQHPRHGLMLPASFLRVAEDTGLIVELGERVLALACADLQDTLADTGLDWISVNVSARQLGAPGFESHLRRVLAQDWTGPPQLKLELTETTLMQHGSPDDALLWRLRALGIGLAVDDFGSGCSSVALKQLPMDSLKADRAFIRALPQDAGERAIITAVLTLARGLGIGVVAEGIDSPAQLDFLRSAGCDYGQGFLLGRPMPAPVLRAWLAERSADPGA